MLDEAINKLTPNFCFHQGGADELIQQVLDVAPEAALTVKKIYEQCKD